MREQDHEREQAQARPRAQGDEPYADGPDPDEPDPDEPDPDRRNPDEDAERRRRRARFLRELNEAKALRERVKPRQARAARMRQQMRMRTFRW